MQQEPSIQERLVNNTNNAIHSARQWYNNLPFFTFALVLITVIFFIISTTINLQNIFGNSAGSTLGKLQIYRLLTFEFVNSNLWSILIVGVFYFPLLQASEMEQGTVKTGLFFIAKNCEIAIVFCLLLAIASNFSDGIAQFYSAGLWPIYFYKITVKAINQPEELNTVICTNIKNKIWPFVIGLFYVLMFRNRFPADELIAVGLAFASKYTDPYYASLLSDQKIAEIEHKPLVQRISSKAMFVGKDKGSQIQTNLITNDGLKEDGGHAILIQGPSAYGNIGDHHEQHPQEHVLDHDIERKDNSDMRHGELH